MRESGIRCSHTNTIVSLPTPRSALLHDHRLSVSISRPCQSTAWAYPSFWTDIARITFMKKAGETHNSSRHPSLPTTNFLHDGDTSLTLCEPNPVRLPRL